MVFTDGSSPAITLEGDYRPTHTLYLDANQFSASSGSVALATVGNCRGFGFDKDSRETISTTFRVPDDIDLTANVSAYIEWSSGNTTAAKDARWDIITVPVAAGESMAGSGNTDSITDRDSTTANALNQTDVVTIAASTEWASTDIVGVEIARAVANASDNVAADIVLYGLRLDYTANKL